MFRFHLLRQLNFHYIQLLDPYFRSFQRSYQLCYQRDKRLEHSNGRQLNFFDYQFFIDKSYLQYQLQQRA